MRHFFLLLTISLTSVSGCPLQAIAQDHTSKLNSHISSDQFGKADSSQDLPKKGKTIPIDKQTSFTADQLPLGAIISSGGHVSE